MNISMNNMNSYVSQLSRVSNSYNQQGVQGMFSNKTASSDEINISSEGKAMSRMLRHQENQDAKQAHKTAFQETYSELGIESLDVANMSDEEMTEVLEAFESKMSEHMHEGYKPASEMSSSELKQTLTNIQDMGTQMSTGKSEYGRPSMGPEGMRSGGKPPMGPEGMKGGRPPNGVKPPQGQTESVETDDSSELLTTLIEALEEASETEETSDDLVETLLEAFNTTENETLYSTYKSMEEMLALMNPAV